MRKDWYNSVAIEFAKMEDVTDDTIHENSRGEVTRLEPDEESEDGQDRTGTMLDPDIFGKFNEENPDAFGHIELPHGIVNIQYTRGRKAELPALLKLPLRKLEKIIYNNSYIRKGDNWEEAITIYTDKEKDAFIQKNGDKTRDSFKIGAAAIEELLAWKGVPTDKYVLHCVPVMPICMRYFKNCNQKTKEITYIPSTLNYLYNRVLIRIDRIKRLEAFQALPMVILLNETRLLQETVDALISNGLRGIPKMDDGYPMDSLDELYRCAATLLVNPRPDLSKFADIKLPEKQIATKLNEYRSVGDEYSKEEDYDPTTEEMEKLDELREQIYDLAKPVGEQILKEYFAKYNEPYENITWLANAVMGDILFSWEPGSENLAKRLAAPLYKNFEIYFRKQFAWKGSAEDYGKEE